MSFTYIQGVVGRLTGKDAAERRKKRTLSSDASPLAANVPCGQIGTGVTLPHPGREGNTSEISKRVEPI